MKPDSLEVSESCLRVVEVIRHRSPNGTRIESRIYHDHLAKVLVAKLMCRTFLIEGLRNDEPAS